MLSNAGNAELIAKLKPPKSNSHSITPPTKIHRVNSSSVQYMVIQHKLRVE